MPSTEARRISGHYGRELSGNPRERLINRTGPALAGVPVGDIVGALARVFGALGIVAVLAPATAQMTDLPDPQHVITTTEARLRSGEGKGFYEIATLPAGRVLLTDGQSDQWRRVVLGPGAEAYVAASDVEVSPDGRTATLVRPSSLKHINQATGKRGSWKPFLPKALPGGTTLQVVRFEDHEFDQYDAYRVIAPEGAHAYIASSEVRRAGDSEIAEHMDQRTLGGREVPSTGLESRVAPRVAENQPSAGQPMRPVPGSIPGTVPGAGPGAGPGGTSPDPHTTRSTDRTSAAPPDTVELVDPFAEAGGEPAGWTGPRHPRQTRPIMSTDELEAAFRTVNAQNWRDAEYDELTAEFTRATDALGSGAEDGVLRSIYARRIEVLRLKRDYQESRRAREESLEAIAEQQESLEKQLVALDEDRRYVVIGRLTTSVVYDGKRLPRMFRIQSVGDRIPRTLGYLKPMPDHDLASKIGRVVGVEGEARLDGDLRLNIITPTRVDVLKPAGPTPEAKPAAQAESPDAG